MMSPYLLPVGHVVREHHEAAVTLEMLRVPALVHGFYTGLKLESMNQKLPLIYLPL